MTEIRMEPIADVAALRPIVQSLIDKGLVISLTPAGRGQIVTHALHLPEELQKVKQAAGATAASAPTAASAATAVPATPASVPPPTPPAPIQAAADSSSENVQQLRRDLDELKSEVARLKSEVDDIWSNLR